VRITHPFHPARGQEFVLVEERRSRHGDRVWYEAEDGMLTPVKIRGNSPIGFDGVEARRRYGRALRDSAALPKELVVER
jgi:hypothetical protein